ncbi:beta-1,3-galactosyltransferase 5-like [Battus philenor]|uniref:beta-1,3-galactosyltransferase 5-like n=1 Tax=Battus philenor TaxID=42288 RepID=UPI0035CF3C98
MWMLPSQWVVCWATKILAIRMVRRKNVVLLVLVMLAILAALPGCWWLASVVGRSLLPPAPPDRDFRHFLHTRSLRHYLSNIDILIEPTTTPCDTLSSISVLILVSSAPGHYKYRDTIRSTWAKYQPTLFVMGLQRTSSDSILSGNYMESKQFKDLLVFDFHDHYENLTLKTALMLQWAVQKCPQVKFLFKTDDDVLVNPWTLQKVLREHPNAQLLGYSINNTKLHRDEYNKYFVPRWLCRDDVVPQYLSGTGYLINGAYLKKILHTSYMVPLVNVEDVYITYLVARKSLNLTLTHDRRLSPKRPWIPLACLYWHLAAVHSLTPLEISKVWPKLRLIATDHKRKKTHQLEAACIQCPLKTSANFDHTVSGSLALCFLDHGPYLISLRPKQPSM